MDRASTSSISDDDPQLYYKPKACLINRNDPKVIAKNIIYDCIDQAFEDISEKIPEVDVSAIYTRRKVSISIPVISGPEDTFEYEGECLGRTYYDAMTIYRSHEHQIDVATDFMETKGQALHRSLKVASKMESVGITKDDIVVICCRAHSDQSIALLGTILMGAIVAPVDPELTLNEFSDIIAKLQPRLCYVDPRTKGPVEMALRKSHNTSTKVVVFTKSVSVGNSFYKFYGKHKFPENYEIADIENPKEKIAFILPTTGNAGKVKLCALTHYAMAFRASIWKKRLMRGVSKVMSWFPLNWYINCLANLSYFELPIVKVIPVPFTERSACKTINDLQVDRVILGTPYALMLARHIARIDYDMSCLRGILIGGTVTTPTMVSEIWKGFPSVRIYQCYGLTETGICSLHCINDALSLKKKASSSGKILPGITIKVQDIRTGETLLPNELGEIFLKTDGLMSHYYKAEELSKALIDDEKFFRTEDVGSFSACEHLYLQGRVMDVFYFDSIPYTCAEIDELIVRHPFVRDVVTVCNESTLISFVILVEGKKMNADDIYQYLKEEVLPFMIPSKIFFVDSYPRTSIGKIKKFVLREKVFNVVHRESIASLQFNSIG